ncbi:MAG TPA: hypothetical protein VFM62_01895 [Arthrobacter sp.]|nr:hypothetical protein [Arthrobacter sp.]
MGSRANLQGKQHDQDWSTPERGQRVKLQHHKHGPVTGVFDMRTDDGAVIWVHLSDGGGRRLIHREDGYRIDRTPDNP